MGGKTWCSPPPPGKARCKNCFLLFNSIISCYVCYFSLPPPFILFSFFLLHSPYFSSSLFFLLPSPFSFSFSLFFLLHVLFIIVLFCFLLVVLRSPFFIIFSDCSSYFVSGHYVCYSSSSFSFLLILIFLHVSSFFFFLPLLSFFSSLIFLLFFAVFLLLFYFLFLLLLLLCFSSFSEPGKSRKRYFILRVRNWTPLVCAFRGAIFELFFVISHYVFAGFVKSRPKKKGFR